MQNNSTHQLIDATGAIIDGADSRDFTHLKVVAGDNAAAPPGIHDHGVHGVAPSIARPRAQLRGALHEPYRERGRWRPGRCVDQTGVGHQVDQHAAQEGVPQEGTREGYAGVHGGGDIRPGNGI